MHEGQSVAVKVEAFPFTRYGTVSGVIRSVSRDSVSDPKLGLSYVAVIRLGSDKILVDGSLVSLNFGLGVTADIKTGSRRIISYLLSPLKATILQSGREK